MLEDKGMRLDAVVEITADADVLVGRIANRAKETPGATRADDNAEVVRNRLDVYKKQTAPLVDYYRGKGLLKTVDGTQPIGDVTAAIKAALA
jgi:adenylate kinase